MKGFLILCIMATTFSGCHLQARDKARESVKSHKTERSPTPASEPPGAGEVGSTSQGEDPTLIPDGDDPSTTSPEEESPSPDAGELDGTELSSPQSPSQPLDFQEESPRVSVTIDSPESFTDIYQQGWHVEMLVAKWCTRCNADEICAGAEADGMQDVVFRVEIGPHGEGMDAYGVDKLPAYIFKNGDRIVDRVIGRNPWPVIKKRLLDFSSGRLKEMEFQQLRLANGQVVSQPVEVQPPQAPMEALPVGTITAKEQIQALIATMKPILGDGGSLTLTYTRQGKSAPLEFGGFSVTIQDKTSVTWTLKEDTLTIKIAPPVQASPGGIKLRLQGLVINETGVVLDVPFVPSFLDPKLRVK